MTQTELKSKRVLYACALRQDEDDPDKFILVRARPPETRLATLVKVSNRPGHIWAIQTPAGDPIFGDQRFPSRQRAYQVFMDQGGNYV